VKQYKELVQHVLENGTRRGDRTGTGTISVFGTQSRYDLRSGFPIVSLKKTFIKSIVKELLWMLRGETNVKTLGCGIWDEWAREDGELDRIYGAQWRKWNDWHYDHATEDYYSEPIDQIANLIQGLKEDPLSRRHIVSAWNPAEIDQMALPPCHTMFQCYASPIENLYCNASDEPQPGYYLDLQLYQRSADLALGVPFNIASYSILLMMLAKECNMIPRFFIHSIGDAHIYENHLDGVKEMLSREPRDPPQLIIADKPMPYPGCPRDGSVLEPDDFKLENYEHHPRIRFSIAV
tara:strand:+ start:41 stop:919 length:879 start_codon:yes stop_codon:yes gene_type:complete